MRNQNRSGELQATLDSLIEEFINDPHYDIRPDGTIWTQITTTGKMSALGTWRLAGSESKDYMVIRFKGSNLMIHRIIYRKFNGPLAEDLMINHIDGNKLNNKPSNLELVPQGANNLHRFRVLKTGPVIGNRKISDAVADNVRNDHAKGISYKKLAEKYGLAKSSISYIVRKRTWNRNVSSDHVFTYKTKASPEMAAEIRTLFSNGMPKKELQKKFNLSKTTVQDICSGKIWK